jgi:lipopolysaccharide transport system ATP-binding protein
MYVRLAFAVAAHLEPEILIVDEVLAVGDAEFQKKCLGKMEEISNGGRTVLFVSHNMDAVQRLCSRGLLLKDGTIVVDGDIRRAVAKYSVRDTAQVPIIDLQRLARPPFVRLRARCTHVRMMSADNHSGWHISYGDQLGFAVSVENDCLLSGLELGISIFSSSSLEITSNLSSHMFTMEKTAAGRHMFRVTYPKLRLIPGSYYVQLGLRSEAGFEDFLPKACEFEVLTSELSSTQMTDTFRGLLVPEAAYEFATLE